MAQNPLIRLCVIPKLMFETGELGFAMDESNELSLGLGKRNLYHVHCIVLTPHCLSGMKDCNLEKRSG